MRLFCVPGVVAVAGEELRLRLCYPNSVDTILFEVSTLRHDLMLQSIITWSESATETKHANLTSASNNANTGR